MYPSWYDFTKTFVTDKKEGHRPRTKLHKGCHLTILVNTKQSYAMLDNIRKFLTILDNIIIFSRILLQLRKERAEIATWTILDNIRQYWTILHNIAQYWTIFDYIWKYPTISSNIVSHLIPQKQTYAIPKFSVPFFFIFIFFHMGEF